MWCLGKQAQDSEYRDVTSREANLRDWISSYYTSEEKIAQPNKTLHRGGDLKQLKKRGHVMFTWRTTPQRRTKEIRRKLYKWPCFWREISHSWHVDLNLNHYSHSWHGWNGNTKKTQTLCVVNSDSRNDIFLMLESNSRVRIHAQIHDKYILALKSRIVTFHGRLSRHWLCSEPSWT